MQLETLRLSLQFGHFPGVARHRAALPRHAVARCLRYALQKPAEITVRIVDVPEAEQLNQSYRGKRYATNVLTFHYSQHPVVQADVVLCAAVVEQEARTQGKTLQAHYAHLLVHAALHAQGYDHEEGERAALEMETLEILLLAALGVACPY